jgi:preprotein translocase subunit Sec63
MGFSDQSGQNNLQYDNAAFFFFLATLLIVGAIIILFFLLKDWKDSQIPRSKVVSSISVLQPQFEATKVLKRSVLKSFGLKIKIFGLVLIGVLLWLINIQIRNTENKLKGFDPYNILGLTP